MSLFGAEQGSGVFAFLRRAFASSAATPRGVDPQAAALLAAIVSSSDDAIVSKTLDGMITSWNAGAQCLFGYTPAEAIGQSMTLIIPTERRPEENESCSVSGVGKESSISRRFVLLRTVRGWTFR